MAAKVQPQLPWYQKYESEISTLLGVIVVVALAAVLFVFIRRSTPQTRPQITDLAETTEENLMNNASKKTYTVKAGEGLWQIAVSQYDDGYKWTEIAKANNLQPPFTLTEGQELELPDVTASASSTPASVALASPTPSPTTRTTASASPRPTATTAPRTTATPAPVQPAVGSYTVKTGDSLWKIAVDQYGDGYRWVEIYRANKELIGSNPGIIYAGQSLTLPNLK